jgi:hypothetical protein
MAKWGGSIIRYGKSNEDDSVSSAKRQKTFNERTGTLFTIANGGKDILNVCCVKGPASAALAI